MTQGNQTYSVLTKKMVPGFEYLGRAAIFIWAFVWSVACVAEFFEGQDSRDETARNALTYEDGLVLANKRLRKPLPKSAMEEVEAMVEIAWRESRFNPKMQNLDSSSHQLFGFLKSTCKNYGGCGDTMSHVRNALAYCYDRHGSAVKALRFHKTLHEVNGKMVYYY